MRNSFIKMVSMTVTLLSISNAILPTHYIYAETTHLETKVENEGTPIDGGTLKYALVGEAFKGIFSSIYYENSQDRKVIDFFDTSLFGHDDNFLINDSGFAKVKFDRENKKVTITIPENTKWDDGEPLTIDDVIYPYYVIAHKDYTGIRYGSDLKNVVGVEEYHDGSATEISGLKRIDDWTLEVTYKEFNNSLLQNGGGILSFIVPKHKLESIPIAEQEDSEVVRQKPVGFGPFRVTSITPGESVLLEANEHYYKGKPKVSNVEVDVVSPSTAVSEMKAGNYDIASLNTDEYDSYKDATNFKTLGKLSNTFSYIGFHMGKWNADKGEVEMDTSKVVSNKSLRQAMGYAIDNAAIGEQFYSGLRVRANTTIPSFFKDYNDANIEGYTYQPEKAKEILAEAGFVDKNNDGFVEAPDGSEFKLKFAAMSGSDVAEPIAQYYIDSWKQIGVNVELLDGRLLELNSFYDLLEKDGDLDIYQAAFGAGGDPNPTDFFGRHADFNYTRWATDENDQLLAAISSAESFDAEVRKQAFSKWQQYMVEEAPVIPTLFRYDLISINNRVKFYDMSTRSDAFDIGEIELTAESPIK